MVLERNAELRAQLPPRGGRTFLEMIGHRSERAMDLPGCPGRVLEAEYGISPVGVAIRRLDDPLDDSNLAECIGTLSCGAVIMISICCGTSS